MATFEESMLEGFSKAQRATFLEMVKSAVQNLGGGFGEAAAGSRASRPGRVANARG
jgi:hypothetical protein